jgi:hypothetical protein
VLSDNGTNLCYVRRGQPGWFNEPDDVGRSLAPDWRGHAKTIAKRGKDDEGGWRKPRT